MKPFIILIVCLIGMVGLLGYMSYQQDRIIQQLRTITISIGVGPIEQPRIYRSYIEVDMLGKIYRVPLDSEGRVK